MIKVNNLSKEFHEQGTSNELLAVDHVDFTIQNGSFCALVGESGSGKSTLAQLMCGLLVQSSGEVLFEGKNISLCRGKQKQVNCPRSGGQFGVGINCSEVTHRSSSP